VKKKKTSEGRQEHNPAVVDIFSQGKEWPVKRLVKHRVRKKKKIPCSHLLHPPIFVIGGEKYAGESPIGSMGEAQARECATGRKKVPYSWRIPPPKEPVGREQGKKREITFRTKKENLLCVLGGNRGLHDGKGGGISVPKGLRQGGRGGAVVMMEKRGGPKKKKEAFGIPGGKGGASCFSPWDGGMVGG